MLLSLVLAGSLCLPSLAMAGTAPVVDLRTFSQSEEKAAEGVSAGEKTEQKPTGKPTADKEKKTEGTAEKKTGSQPLPKNDPLRKTREVDFTVQHGQLISEAIGDIDGDGSEEVVDLMGNPVVEKSSFMGDMYLIVREVGAKDPGKVKYYYRPKDLGGYNAYLTLADVTGDGYPDVIIAAPSGGSGGMVSYWT